LYRLIGRPVLAATLLTADGYFAGHAKGASADAKMVRGDIMHIDEWIDRLNELSKPTEAQTRSLKGQELLNFLKNPPRIDVAPFDEAINPIVRAFAAADLQHRRAISAKLSSYTSGYLLGYRRRMAEEAVRRSSPDLVRLGLMALALDGGRTDLRDVIVRLALLHHSALKLNMDARAAFDEVAAFAVDDSLSQAMRSFPLREPKNRDIGTAFRYRETVTDKGFAYKQLDQ
jgi:hypothetical protein